MMIRNVMAAAFVLTLGSAAFGADLKSGPQAGQDVPGPFHPLNINGNYAGKKACLYCAAGDAPTVAVFARTAECPCAAKLIKQLDAATKKNEKANLNAFVVFCSDDEKLEGTLKKMVEEAKIEHCVVGLDSATGPAKYSIAEAADITILIYKDYTVTANYAFGKGKMTEEDLKKVMADVEKIVK